MEEDQVGKIQASMNSMLEMDEFMAKDCINFIFTQLNSESFVGKINEMEYQALMSSANKGLNKIVYLKHYSRDIVSKKAFAVAARNLMLMLYTRPLNGNDREVLFKQFESNKPQIVTK